MATFEDVRRVALALPRVEEKDGGASTGSATDGSATDGCVAVLSRLTFIGVDHLHELITDSWLLKAPKRVSKQWLEENGMA
ncbi:MAG: hypothetical protein QM607_08205 [Microbacterium sp.]